MLLPKESYTVEISSFAGISPGAEHYYANVYKHNTGKLEKFELRRTVTTEKEAKYLDMKRKSGGLYFQMFQRGRSCVNVFNSEEEAIETALSTIQGLNPDLIIKGSFATAQPQFIIFAKNGIKEEANKLFFEFDKMNWDNPKQENRMEEICEEWERLINKK